MLSDKDSVKLLDLRKMKADGRLTQRGEEVLADLEKQALPETNLPQRAVIGFGRGLLDVGQGAKQLGMQAGESAGLLDPGSTEAYTAGVNRDLAEYNKLSAAYPWSTGGGRVAGNIAAAPVPGIGQTTATRLATAPIIGGLLGGSTYQEDPTIANRSQSALFGAGGALGGEALGAGISRAMSGGRATPMPVPLPEMAGNFAGREAGIGRALPPPSTAAAVTPEYGIPLTAGQQARDLDQQIFEQRVLHGNLGPGAAEDLTAFEARQQQIINEAEGTAHRRATGRERRPVGEEAAGVQAGLAGRAEELWGDIDAAYTYARQAGAELPYDDTVLLFDRMRNSLDRYDMSTPQVNPKTHEFMERLDEFFPDLEPGQEVVGIDAFGIDGLRRELNDYIGSATASDARNLRNLRGVLDSELLRAADEGRLIGDPDGVRMLQEGIKLRADYGRLYGPRWSRSRSGRNRTDPVGGLIEDIIETDIPGEQIVDRVFGTGRLGSNRKIMEGVFRRVEDIAGRDSPEYQMLRSVAMERFRKSIMTGDNVSPQKLVTEWGRLMRETPELLQTVFDPEQIDAVSALAQEVGQTIYMQRAMNPSKTAFMLANIMRQTGAPAAGATIGMATGGPAGAAAGAAIGAGYDALGGYVKNSLGRLFGQRIYKPLVTPPPGGATLGRALGLEAERQYEESTE